MKLFHYLSALVLLAFVPMGMQAQDFTIESDMPGLPDGLSVSLLAEGGTSTEIASTTVSKGKFVLKGHVDHPRLCTLVTNNLSILPADNQDMSLIRWTYTQMFVSNTAMTFHAVHYDSIDSERSIAPTFSITGGQPQADFNAYNLQLQQLRKDTTKAAESRQRELEWRFIAEHPHSSVSLYLADKMLMQASPRLSKAEVQKLSSLIGDVPDDSEQLQTFRIHCQAAERTAAKEQLYDLPLVDRQGQAHRLVEVVPRGKYVLVDFWASWCGICRAQIPEVKKLAKQFADKLTVVSVSDDRNRTAWLKAVDKEQMSWAQYCLTPEGSKALAEKYLVQGVPYYILVGPDGRVVGAPGHPSDVVGMMSAQ